MPELGKKVKPSFMNMPHNALTWPTRKTLTPLRRLSGDPQCPYSQHRRALEVRAATLAWSPKLQAGSAWGSLQCMLLEGGPKLRKMGRFGDTASGNAGG